MHRKQGFTLMEVIAVLLTLALVIRFMSPMFRRVRDEVRYQQARSAAVKMADAIRSYYQNTKGYIPEGCIGKGGACVAPAVAASRPCNDVAASGIPPTDDDRSVSLWLLFACDYLQAKDFAGLPYNFSSDAEQIFTQDDPYLVKVDPRVDESGPRHQSGFYVSRDMSIRKYL